MSSAERRSCATRSRHRALLPPLPPGLPRSLLKMQLSVCSIAAAASWLALVPPVLAGFDPGSSKNIAVYWGETTPRHTHLCRRPRGGPWLTVLPPRIFFQAKTLSARAVARTYNATLPATATVSTPPPVTASHDFVRLNRVTAAGSDINVSANTRQPSD